MTGVEKHVQSNIKVESRWCLLPNLPSSNYKLENFYGKILWKKVTGMIKKVGIWEEFMEDVAFLPSSSS